MLSVFKPITLHYCYLDICFLSIYYAGFYDYLLEDHSFSFGPSFDLIQCTHIQILKDEFTENDEFFRVSMQNTQGMNIPEPQTLVIIQDSSTTTGMYTLEVHHCVHTLMFSISFLLVLSSLIIVCDFVYSSVC